MSKNFLQYSKIFVYLCCCIVITNIHTKTHKQNKKHTKTHFCLKFFISI